MTQRIYRTELLVTPDQGRTPDDLLAEAIRGCRYGNYGQVERGDAAALAGGLVSVKVTFTAPDDGVAALLARTAQREVSGPADITKLTTGTGRHFRRLDPTYDPRNSVR